ncbi:cytochrome c oxidase subunit II [Oculatella sp. LEGE 06141]|uniref:cytochrome c oxidase subunit II n=1 Tax=Oculatella sp. LEGE 06141 TaxID=1828648 RepID=UPI00188085E5|nr:cytochrome c oxidase subunit II [Oculatella sp. LEGE 06141]MBE9182699.1 cytochrome c oxidase subunit II [Oculatella sp. LEGE 06141]
MLKVLEYCLVTIFIAVALFISHWLGQQAYTWMPPQATAEAQRVDALFSFLVAIGAFVFLGLVGMMVYSALFFRAKPDDYSEGHPARGSVKLEILWTVAPTLLVLWIAAQNITIYNQLNILGLKQIVHFPIESPAYAATDQPKPVAEQIQVIAKQWEWGFRYPNQAASHELHLPVNESTRLNLQAEKVIHGFYVPAFRLKQDMVPGRNIGLVVTPTRIGKYRLQDSQYSGTYFALMEADVYVEPREAYNQWIANLALNPADTTNFAIAEQQHSPKTLFQTGWQTGSLGESVAKSDRLTEGDS